jgi:hypothetical protein
VCSHLGKLVNINAGVKSSYTLAVMSYLRCTCLVAIAVLVAAFVALYPLLDCGPGGCPEVSQTSHAAHAGLSTACLAAVLVGLSVAAPIFFPSLGRRRIANPRRPIETYLSPEAPPPRVLPSC